VNADRQLAVRVGIHTGPVVVSQLGGKGRRETLALGETTNVAARVQGVAAPDTVVMSVATQALVPGIFVVEDLGAQTVKGVAVPLVCYRVLQPSGVRSRLDVAAGRLTPFVGRDLELGTLADRWERAAEGEGQNVLVVGEAGVGKSRLVYQLRERLAAVPHTWLECGATPYTAGTPFHPVIALVAQGLAFAPVDTAAEKLAKIERGLGGLATAEMVTLLADLVGLPPPTRLQLSPELQRRKTIELLVQWTFAISAVQPLVLLVEDLHWCDPSSLELLGDLVGQSPTARILLLVTARPEFTPPWPAAEHMTTLPLARLNEREAREMVTTLAGEVLPVDTLAALVARADGVPLYIEELTRSVIDPGTARSVEAIPATLADSLMGRLDRLSATKEVAQRAAVLGREFSYRLLAAVAGLDEAALRHGLERLVEAEIVFARGEPPEATYTFKHALLQEAAYGSLLKRTRQQLHARIAQVLDERFPERVASEPEVIARHYDQAGLAAPAIAHYQRAGERAAERSANEEAIGHLRHALALVGTLPETRERHQRELGLQMAIGAPLAAARGWSHPEFEGTYARASWLLISASRPSCLECSWEWRPLISSGVTLRPRSRSRGRRWRPPSARETRSTFSRLTSSPGLH
jgi:predicted ATPase